MRRSAKPKPAEEELISIHAMLQDAFCYEWQDRKAVFELSKRLVEEASLDKHWTLIRKLFRWWAPETYRHFANHVALEWCGTGERMHLWQQHADLPASVRFSIGTRRAALKEVYKAAKLLEKALRNPAVDSDLGDYALGTVDLPMARVVRNSRSKKTISLPVAHLPLAANFGDDSLLDRLLREIAANTFVRHRTWTRKAGVNSREAYFAQCTARYLAYFDASRRKYRPRIECFIADLIEILNRWEGRTVDYDSERVRQSLRRALSETVQPL